MMSVRNFMPARPTWLAGFALDQRGVSAVEFALLLPLMVGLYLGGIEISQAVSVDRKVSLTSRVVADLIAQVSNVNNADMTNILNAGTAVTAPFPKVNLKITVSSVKIDGNKNATVEWSDTLNGTVHSQGDPAPVPSGLAVANTWMIWAEVEYSYKPTIGYTITGTLPLKDQMFMRPRLADFVTRSAT